MTDDLVAVFLPRSHVEHMATKGAFNQEIQAAIFPACRRSLEAQTVSVGGEVFDGPNVDELPRTMRINLEELPADFPTGPCTVTIRAGVGE